TKTELTAKNAKITKKKPQVLVSALQSVRVAPFREDSYHGFHGFHGWETHHFLSVKSVKSVVQLLWLRLAALCSLCSLRLNFNCRFKFIVDVKPQTAGPRFGPGFFS